MHKSRHGPKTTVPSCFHAPWYECIEGESDGQLRGKGRWQLTRTGAGTHVRYDWKVAVTKRWMMLLAPLLRPAFEWNHGIVMEWRRKGLTERLSKQAATALI